LADLNEFEKFNEIYAQHTCESGGKFNMKWDVNLNAAAVNVGGHLRETRSSSSFRPTSLTNIYDVVNAAAANLGGHLCQPESSSSFRPTSLTNIYDVVNAAAANLGGHLCQPESSSSFCQASFREILYNSLGDGTASNVV
ncbi:hypothetical protein Tco_1139973, partial [Tanacetum coccineum]